MTQSFVHLRLHTDYSLRDGMVKVKKLGQKAAEMGMGAIAVTDHSNLFSLVKFYKYSTAAGVKPIAGVDVWVVDKKGEGKPCLLTLFAQDYRGYIILSELISKGYQLGQSKEQGVVVTKAWIEENIEDSRDHLIVLSGGMEGDIGKALLDGRKDDAEAMARYWGDLFPQAFYIEVQRVNKPNEEIYNQAAVDLAYETGLPVVATNDVRFIKETDFNAHEVRVCIHDGAILNDPDRPRNYTKEQYLKSPEAMAKLFADIPGALENTVEIAKRCNIEMTFGKNYLPDYPVPEGMTLAAYFEEESRKGLRERLDKHAPVGKGTLEENTVVYEKRLQFELDVINQMGFPGYFMIVADFIQWAKNNGIPVGPGRGSGAGSLVAYALKITDLDPLAYDLLFERFLNPERVSMPDFDVDFCMDRRDEVIAYVARRYGRDHVSQIITYGSMAAKAVTRDVGRVLGHPYGFVDKVAKLIPNELGITLDKAIKDSPDLNRLYNNDEAVSELLNIALQLEGMARNAGKHAGGVVISPTPLTDFSPLYCEEDGSNLVTQYDKDDVEAVGLVKFDFLGLRTLTIIDWALQAINAKNKAKGLPEVDISQIPMTDEGSFELLKNAETTAVFQLESRGMKELIKKLKPDCFDDIIALVALYRPGPLEAGMVDDYINVKHGAKASYLHPALEPILKTTNGVILYQEQVMQIARELAGYTLGGADMLRRAMGKKKPEEMAKQRAVFTDGSVKNGISEEIATAIFDLMEKFAGYGFNKSHSAAYALIAYQTAWLKRHYPAEFMAAVLSSDMDKTEKVVIFLEECREMGIEVLAPDINLSEINFKVNDSYQIVYGLGAIKGVGATAIEEILSNRRQHGAFTGLHDLCQRVNLSKVNKRVLEGLIKAGAFDAFHPNRAAHLSEVNNAVKIADQRRKKQSHLQDDLFGLNEQVVKTDDSKSYIDLVAAWPEKEKLDYEKLVLGLFLSGHPIDEYADDLRKMVSHKLGDIDLDSKSTEKTKVRVAGLVVDSRVRQTKSGSSMISVVIDDRSGRLEFACFSGQYEKFKDILKNDTVILVDGLLNFDEYSNKQKLSVLGIKGVDDAREIFTKSIELTWYAKHINGETFIEGMKDAILPYLGGTCPIYINYITDKTKCQLMLGKEWNVKVTNDLKSRLNNFIGKENVVIQQEYF